MAVYRYSAANGDRLPDDVVGKDGKPLLSWRVLLLPHLGHDDLYKKFKLDEAWDSTNNLPLVGLMPAVFASSRLPTKEAGHTVYQGFSGPDGLFRTGKEPYLINRVPDGPTLTLLAVESSNPVPWSKPEDIPFDKHKDVPNFGSAYGGRPWAVLLDGKVRVLDLGKIRPDTLKYAINPNDGTVPGDDWKP
jgi:hypothetical protein